MKGKKAFKFWWGWNPDRIEKYLEKMALEGWRLSTVEFSQMLFGFVPDKEKKTRYCFDYQNKLDPEYVSILNADGWEIADKCAGWILWKKDYIETRPAIYILTSRNFPTKDQNLK